MNVRGAIPPTKSNRTIFTTLIGITAVLIGAIGSIFSLFALLLAIGKPYATGNETFTDIFLIFILPPSIFLAGIGILLRHRWARFWMILLMAALVTLGIQGFFPKKTQSSKYDYYATTPDARATRNLWSGAYIAIGSLTLIGLFSKPVRNEFHGKTKNTPPPMPQQIPDSHISGNQNQGWRVGHRGRDMMFYEENHNGTWQRIDIDGEMLMGRAHHVIYFRNTEDWKNYPEWASERRDEIIARIKSHFREPDYEYYNDGPSTTPPPVPQTP